MKKRGDIPRFMENVKVSETGCWLWQKELNKLGYGSFWMDGESMGAYRAAYILLVGPVPKKKHVHHLCENRACVNPAHLTLLSAAEHMVKHGIQLEGSRVNRGKTHCPHGHE